jgi:hypothetical protein
MGAIDDRPAAMHDAGEAGERGIGMPRTGTFTYQVDAGSDPAAAIALFSDLSHHDRLHPLIVKVEPAAAPDGAIRRFLITDRMAVGPFRFPITYTADILSVTPDRVVSVARQKPSVTLRNDTRLTTVDSRVRADVEITLTAPAPLFSYAFSQARTAHLELADRIAELLAGPAA